MKKFFEKNDLFKIVIGMILLTVLLTWLIPVGYFSAGEFVKDDLSRVGIFDLFESGYSIIRYFTEIVTFIFVLGAFYQFLSSLGAYQKLTNKISEKLKGKELIFSLVVSFVFAALTSILSDYYVVIFFIPFVVTICNKLKMDKVSTFVTTFGSIFVGLVGSTINGSVANLNVQAYGVEYTTDLLYKIVLFFITYIIYSVFNVLYVKNINIFAKLSKDKKKNTKKTTNNLVACEDMFVSDVKVDKKTNMLPLIIVSSLVLVISLLAFIPWSDVFKVEWFTNALTTVTETKVFGKEIFSYFLGSTTVAFGSWTLYGLETLMIVSMIVLQICYKVSVDNFIDSFATGFKKVSKYVVLVVFAYLVLVISTQAPFVPVISNSLLGTKFNVFTTSLSGIISSLFSTDYRYTLQYTYSFFATNYTNNISLVSILLSAIYGLVQFVAPASAVMLFGLSYLDIPYKKWLNYIWKFLVAMLVIIIVLALILK